METFSALLVICAGNSPVTGEFPVQRPVTRSIDVFFDLRLNKRLNAEKIPFDDVKTKWGRHKSGVVANIPTYPGKPFQLPTIWDAMVFVMGL